MAGQAGDAVECIGDAVAVAVRAIGAGERVGFQDVAMLGGGCGVIPPQAGAGDFDGGGAGEAGRFTLGEIPVVGHFAGGPDELAGHDLVAQAHPVATRADGCAEHGRDGGLFVGAGDAEQVAAAGSGIGQCLLEGEGAIDERVTTEAHLHAVAEAVPVGIGHQRVAAEATLQVVREPVAVAIGEQRIGSGRHLGTVGQRVAIGIGISRIGAQQILLFVGKTILIRIVTGVVDQGVEAVVHLIHVGHAITVGVGGGIGCHIEVDGSVGGIGEAIVEVVGERIAGGDARIGHEHDPEPGVRNAGGHGLDRRAKGQAVGCLIELAVLRQGSDDGVERVVVRVVAGEGKRAGGGSEL